MQLYFRNSQNKERLIAECKTIQEMNAAIKQFLQEYNFKSYYTRIWYEPESTETPLYTRTKGRFIYDFGSHFEFIELEISTEEIDILPDHMKQLMNYNYYNK